MLVEGLYLHTIIVCAFSASRIRLWYYVIVGWGGCIMPLQPTDRHNIHNISNLTAKVYGYKKVSSAVRNDFFVVCTVF